MLALADGEQDTVRTRWVASDRSSTKGLEALFELERMVLRKGRRCGADATDRSDFRAAAPGDAAPDIVIDFTSAERDSVSERMPPHQPVPITATSICILSSRASPSPRSSAGRGSG